MFNFWLPIWAAGSATVAPFARLLVAAAGGDSGISVDLPTILTSSGFTVGGALATLFFLLSRGILWTANAHKEVIAGRDREIETLKATQTAIVSELREQLKTSIGREGEWRTVADAQRTRADGLQKIASEEFLPALRQNSGLLTEIVELLKAQGSTT